MSETRRHTVGMHASTIIAFGLRPWTLKIFSAMSTRVMNACGKFHWNPFTKYRDIASREIGVNGRTDGRMDWKHIMPPPLDARKYRQRTDSQTNDSYDVGFGVVDAFLKTLERHPLDRQFTLAVVTAVIVALVDVTRQAEVSHFDVHLIVQPTAMSHIHCAQCHQVSK